jgi:hypothetical protein
MCAVRGIGVRKNVVVPGCHGAWTRVIKHLKQCAYHLVRVSARPIIPRVSETVPPSIDPFRSGSRSGIKGETLLKHWILTGTLGVLVAVSGIAAHAYDQGYGIETSGKGYGEPSLDAIINTGYSTNGSSTPNVAGLSGGALKSNAGATFLGGYSGIFFHAANQDAPVTYDAHFSADQTSFGYYTPGDFTPADTTVLTTNSTNGPISPPNTGSIPIGVNPFGLFIQDQPNNNGNYFFSQKQGNTAVENGGQMVTLNQSVTTDPNGNTITTTSTIDSRIHVLVYQSTTQANTYFLGFEDLTGSENDGNPFGGGSDRDYNDFVVKVSNVTLSPSLPEPAFYQMSVFLAGGGLMVLKMRRRSKAN